MIILRSTHKEIVQILEGVIARQSAEISDLKDERLDLLQKLLQAKEAHITLPQSILVPGPNINLAKEPDPEEGLGDEFDTPRPMRPIMTPQGPRLAGPAYVSAPRPFTKPPSPPPAEDPAS